LQYQSRRMILRQLLRFDMGCFEQGRRISASREE
jgi:hypothetical protein